MRNAERKMQNINNESAVKRYQNPEIEIIKLENEDIITTSPGTETTPKEDNDGIWDFDLG